MTYQKLFTIEYNKKNFMLFLDENNRTTFLEINDSGEYEYPTLEDFIALNKIYNNNNPFICYSIPKFKFKECVKQVKNGVLSLLTVLTLINSIPSASAGEVKYEINDKSIVLSYDPFYIAENYLKVLDTNDLEKILGKVNITEELITETINNNDKIPEDIKKVAIDEFKRYYKEHPSANYRVFYENMKVLEVIVHTNEEYREKYSDIPGSGANFNALDHRINLIEGYSENTLRHEIAHTNQVLWIQYEDNFVIVADRSTALQEGMTDIVSKYNRDSGSYFISSKFVEYLMNLSDYTFEDFSRLGIQGLLDKVSILYPDIDVNYISRSLDAMVNTEIQEAVQIKEDNILMYDELFEICLKNIKPDNGYESFLNFMSLLSDVKDKSLVTNYYNKYNEELKRLGYYNILANHTIQENISKYEKANDVIYNSDGDISFGYVQEGNENTHYKIYKIESDGKTIEDQNYGSLGIRNFEIFKLEVLLKYPNNIEEGIKKTIIEKKMISPHYFMAIPIYLNGNLLTTMQLSKLNIQVGQTKDGKIGYVIKSNNEIVYATELNMTNLSSQIALSYYIRNYSNNYVEVLDLNQVLNDNFLIKFQKETGIFSNLEIVNNNINFIRPVEPSVIPQIVESAVNRIEISKDNKVLGEFTLEDLFITIGLTPDKRLGFIISDRQGNVIYENNPEITENSIPVNFLTFLGDIPTEKIELNNILNDEYVKKIQEEKECFSNITIQKDKMEVDATPTITITNIVNEREIRQTYKMSKCRIYIGNGSYIVGGSRILPEGFSYEQSISIEELFTFFNMLDNGVPAYIMSSDELDTLVNNYLRDTNTKGR